MYEERWALLNTQAQLDLDKPPIFSKEKENVDERSSNHTLICTQ